MLPLLPLDLVTTQHMVTLTIGLGVGGTLTYDPNYLSQTTAGQTYFDLKRGAIDWPDPMPSEGARRIDDLWHAAVNGRGRYFATNNANTLSNALSGALADATKATGSAAGAATNSLEPVVGENNKAFIATYTTLEWTGDIRAYALDAMTGVIDTSTSAWSAKTQLEALAAGSRNIKYMNSSKVMRAFNYANLTADGFGANFSNLCSKTPTPLQCTTLGTAQVTLANTGTNLVSYLRGDNTYDAAVNSTNPLYRARTAKLGDIINASPVYEEVASAVSGHGVRGLFCRHRDPQGDALLRGQRRHAARVRRLHRQRAVGLRALVRDAQHVQVGRHRLSRPPLVLRRRHTGGR